MVENDEFDRGPRNIFNYGHSFGHAIETATDFRVPHGIAVAFGMDLANVLSVERGLLSVEQRNRMRAVIGHVVAETDLEGVDGQQLFAALRRDKKNVGDDINVILTRGVGDMFKTTLEANAAVEHRIDAFVSERLWERDL